MASKYCESSKYCNTHTSVSKRYICSMEKDANTYYLEEYGPVEFGFRFCQGLNDF